MSALDISILSFPFTYNLNVPLIHKQHFTNTISWCITVPQPLYLVHKKDLVWSQNILKFAHTFNHMLSIISESFLFYPELLPSLLFLSLYAAIIWIFDQGSLVWNWNHKPSTWPLYLLPIIFVNLCVPDFQGEFWENIHIWVPISVRPSVVNLI